MCIFLPINKKCIAYGLYIKYWYWMILVYSYESYNTSQENCIHLFIFLTITLHILVYKKRHNFRVCYLLHLFLATDLRIDFIHQIIDVLFIMRGSRSWEKLYYADFLCCELGSWKLSHYWLSFSFVGIKVNPSIACIKHFADKKHVCNYVLVSMKYRCR